MFDKKCLWCGNDYIEGMEGICRSCWEKNQFSQEEEMTEKKLRPIPFSGGWWCPVCGLANGCFQYMCGNCDWSML